MRNKIISILFCVVLALGITVSAIIPDKYYSESEKRLLQQFPSFTFKALVSGKYGEDIEDYLQDQFPARDGWITVKTLTELISGKRDISGVYFGSDGYLIQKFDSYDEENFKKNVEALKTLTDSLNEKGVPVKVILVPTAVDVLSDKLPAFAPKKDQSELISYAKDAGLDIIDVTDILNEHNDEYIFYKNDHHFTSLGAYYVYEEYMNAIGKVADPLENWQSKVLCDNFRGTTYSKVNYPFAKYDTITAYYKNEKHNVSYNGGSYVTDSIYEEKYLDGKDQYATFLNSNQATTVVSGEGDGKLLIIKDSYANCFSQFVIDDYEETHLIDLRFFNESVSDYIEANGITDVLVMYNVPNFADDTAVSKIK